MSILSQSRDEKSHFKSKIRHFFERLVRKFGMEMIEMHVPESDKKLIANIRKRKERLKKKKSENEVNSNEKSKDKEFNQAMYASDSELESEQEESSDDEAYIPDEFKDESLLKIQQNDLMLRDDVIDFLDSNNISSQMASGSLNKKSKMKKKVGSEFKTDTHGKLILNDSDESDLSDKEMTPAQPDYYKESLTNEASFTRTLDGRIKFNDKNSGKRKRSEDQEEDPSNPSSSAVGVDWRHKNHSSKKNKSQDQAALDRMLGRQYKAKKARGDVKRAGMADPHAYIPLSSKIVGNKRKSTQMTSTFKNIIKATKNGSELPGEKKQVGKGMKKGNKKHRN